MIIYIYINNSPTFLTCSKTFLDTSHGLLRTNLLTYHGISRLFVVETHARQNQHRDPSSPGMDMHSLVWQLSPSPMIPHAFHRSKRLKETQLVASTWGRHGDVLIATERSDFKTHLHMHCRTVKTPRTPTTCWGFGRSRGLGLLVSHSDTLWLTMNRTALTNKDDDLFYTNIGIHRLLFIPTRQYQDQLAPGFTFWRSWHVQHCLRVAALQVACGLTLPKAMHLRSIPACSGERYGPCFGVVNFWGELWHASVENGKLSDKSSPNFSHWFQTFLYLVPYAHGSWLYFSPSHSWNL